MPARIRVRQPDFGRNLERLRRACRRPDGSRGLDRTELAERAGLSRKTIQRLEDGHHERVLEHTLWQIARALDVPFTRLVDEFRVDPPATSPGEGGAGSDAHLSSGATTPSAARHDAGSPAASGRPAGDSAAAAAAETRADAAPPPTPRTRPAFGRIGLAVVLVAAAGAAMLARQGRHDPPASDDAIPPHHASTSPADPRGGSSAPADRSTPAPSTRPDPGRSGGPTARRDDVPAALADSVPVFAVSTRVPCAYRAFVEGLRYLRQAFRTEALDALERAIGCDSTFALAWAMWADPFVAAPQARARRGLERARRHLGGALEWERDYVHALVALQRGDLRAARERLDALVSRRADIPEAWRLLGDVLWRVESPSHDVERAGFALEAALRLAPRDALAFRALAHAYARSGHLERALDVTRRFRKRLPGRAASWVATGEVLAVAGRWDDAVEAFRTAIAYQPGDRRATVALAAVHVARGQFETAAQRFGELTGSRDPLWRGRGRCGLALVALAQGRLDSALATLQSGEIADRVEGVPVAVALRKQVLAARILGEIGERNRATELAADAARRAMESPCTDCAAGGARVVARFDPAAARSLLETLHHRGIATPVADAYVALADGRAEHALARLEGVAHEPRVECVRARALVALGRNAEARRVLEAVTADGSYEALEATLDVTRARRLLGEVCRRLGEVRAAATAWRGFVDRWSQCDAHLRPEVEDVRRLLASLPASATGAGGGASR